jgi:hypothetical protein
MAEPIATALRTRLEALNKDAPNQRLPFIVTLRPGASATDVAAAGMQIDQHIPEPPLLLGTMTPRQALAVGRLDNVARVEEDTGGVHTL